jgi:hypothetical protein
MSLIGGSMFNRTHLLAIVLMAAGVAQAAVVVAGKSYADNAGVDQLLGSAGSFTTSGGSLASVLTDTNAASYAFSFSPASTLTLGWAGRAVTNGVGADIDLYELGTPDSLAITINGITKTYLSQITGAMAGGYALNRVGVDLADFGIATGAGVSSLIVGMGITAGTVPSLSYVAGNYVAAVPESSSIALMGLGLIGLAGVTRRRR